MGRVATFVILAALAVPSIARAEVFKLYGELHGGGMYGQGIAGEQQAESFFQKSRGAGYGAQIGGQFLIFDGHVHHHQYVNGDGLKTWTQFTAGVNFGSATLRDVTCSQDGTQQTAVIDTTNELGSTLAAASVDVPLNHPHCAKFCVLGGASCSAAPKEPAESRSSAAFAGD